MHRWRGRQREHRWPRWWCAHIQNGHQCTHRSCVGGARTVGGVSVAHTDSGVIVASTNVLGGVVRTVSGFGGVHRWRGQPYMHCWQGQRCTHIGWVRSACKVIGFVGASTNDPGSCSRTVGGFGSAQQSAGSTVYAQSSYLVVHAVRWGWWCTKCQRGWQHALLAFWRCTHSRQVRRCATVGWVSGAHTIIGFGGASTDGSGGGS